MMKSAYLATKRYLIGLLVAGSFFGGLGGVQAAIVQPNGVTIPAGGGTAVAAFMNGSANNGGVDEGMNGVTDAAIEPQMFSPLCDFSGLYVAKGGGANFAIGWYKGTASRLLAISFRND